MERFSSCFAALFLLLSFNQNAISDPIYWTDWTSASGLFGFDDASGQTDTAAGVIQLPSSDTINVGWTGNAWNVTTAGGPGPEWEYPPYFPYTSPEVDNAPPFGEEIGLQFIGSSTLTFDTPVVNPVFAIKSLGNNILDVTYTFDAPFTVLSGTNYSSVTPVITSNSVTGSEFHGVLQFTGTFNSISWDISGNNEYRHYFTVGTAMTSPVPLPPAMYLMASGLILLIFKTRKT